MYTQKGKSKGQLNPISEFLVPYILIELGCLFVCLSQPCAYSSRTEKDMDVQFFAKCSLNIRECNVFVSNIVTCVLLAKNDVIATWLAEILSENVKKKTPYNSVQLGFVENRVIKLACKGHLGNFAHSATKIYTRSHTGSPSKYASICIYLKPMRSKFVFYLESQL